MYLKEKKENGFEEIRQVGSHKQFKNYETGKSVTVPFHNKDLKKGTEQSILKKAGLK